MAAQVRIGQIKAIVVPRTGPRVRIGQITATVSPAPVATARVRIGQILARVTPAQPASALVAVGGQWVAVKPMVRKANAAVSVTPKVARGGVWVPVSRGPIKTPYVRPAGAGLLPYESLPNKGTLAATINQITSGSQVTFLPGTFSFSNFLLTTGNPVYGVYCATNVFGLRGSGPDPATGTVWQMVPHTSDKASTIPAQSTGSTNQLTYLRLGGGSASTRVAVILDGIAFLATAQGHDYNGVQLFYSADGSIVRDCLMKSFSGSAAANPGETFGLNLFHDVNTRLVRVEIDATAADDVTHLGGSAFGYNFSAGGTTQDCTAHGVRYGAGITQYFTTGDFTHNNFHSYDNVIPFNMERCVGSVTLNRPVLQNNRTRTTNGAIIPVHIVCDSDQGSTVLTVVDPIIDGGTPTPSNPFVITRHATYAGVTNKQLASDFHLILSGVERPDCLRVATNETLPTTL